MHRAGHRHSRGTLRLVVRDPRLQLVRGGVWCLTSALLTAACASPSSGVPASVAPTITSLATATTVVTVPQSAVSTSVDIPTPTKTTTANAGVDPDLLDDISKTSVPANVIVPTSETSLDPATNPVNGRRGGRRPLPDDFGCVTPTTQTCLPLMLDTLGFDVTSGPREERTHRVQRATAVVQLDAGLEMTGVPDDDLLEYLNVDSDTTVDPRADEVREVGSSAKGRPIMAVRYGDGPRTVLVVGQTHGDEEGGLRVLLRARSLPLPDDLTLWVIPTMNPDGQIGDTRFLANGADPNRKAVSQLEQQAVYDFAIEVRPSLTVWYHQNYGWVGGSGASYLPAKRYQARTGLGTLKRSGDCAKGFLWCPIDEAIGSSSILVELPDVLTPADVQIHALALLEVASSDAP